jgi:hypothetical protein
MMPSATFSNQMPKGTPSKAIAEVFIFSIKLKADERERYAKLWAIAKKRHRFVNKSDVNRELVGLTPKFVFTDEEIRYFRTGEPLRDKK